jgi:hypothetical protein
MASDAPQCIRVGRHRDLTGRAWEIWVRRALFAVPLAILALALANVFGQRPVTRSAASPEASLSMYAPDHVRGGDLFVARFHVQARTTLTDARLVLGSGWLEGMTVNAVSPNPSSETSANGSLSLDLGKVDAGRSYLLFADFQVNPTNVGRRPADVELYDGQRRLLRISREITVFP